MLMMRAKLTWPAIAIDDAIIQLIHAFKCALSSYEVLGKF